jgi:hypothetical protein
LDFAPLLSGWNLRSFNQSLKISFSDPYRASDLVERDPAMQNPGSPGALPQAASFATFSKGQQLSNSD